MIYIKRCYKTYAGLDNPEHSPVVPNITLGAMVATRLRGGLCANLFRGDLFAPSFLFVCFVRVICKEMLFIIWGLARPKVF